MFSRHLATPSCIIRWLQRRPLHQGFARHHGSFITGRPCVKSHVRRRHGKQRVIPRVMAVEISARLTKILSRGLCMNDNGLRVAGYSTLITIGHMRLCCCTCAYWEPCKQIFCVRVKFYLEWLRWRYFQSRNEGLLRWRGQPPWRTNSAQNNLLRRRRFQTREERLLRCCFQQPWRTDDAQNTSVLCNTFSQAFDGATARNQA